MISFTKYFTIDTYGKLQQFDAGSSNNLIPWDAKGSARSVRQQVVFERLYWFMIGLSPFESESVLPPPLFNLQLFLDFHTVFFGCGPSFLSAHDSPSTLAESRTLRPLPFNGWGFLFPDSCFHLIICTRNFSQQRILISRPGNLEFPDRPLRAQNSVPGTFEPACRKF